MQDALNITKNEVQMNKRSVQIQRQIENAKFEKELEMLEKFEKWLNAIEDERKDLLGMKSEKKRL